MQKLIFLLCRILAVLPLKSLHAMAGFWGGFAFYLLHKDRARIRENLQIAGLPADDAAVKKVLRETAKGALELPVAFFRRPEDIETLFREVHGWQHIQAALDAGEGSSFPSRCPPCTNRRKSKPSMPSCRPVACAAKAAPPPPTSKA